MKVEFSFFSTQELMVMLARWMGKNKMVHIIQNQLVKKGAEKMKSSAVDSLLVSSVVM